MEVKIPCTSCSDWQLSTMRVSIARFTALLLILQVKADVFRVWPSHTAGEGWCLQGMAIQLVGGLFQLFFALDMDHCSSQLKSGEHPGPSTHKHTTDPHFPPAHTDSDTNVHPLVNTYTYKYIHIMHTNMHTLTYTNTKLNTHITITLSFSLSCTTMILECTLALFIFTFCLHWTEYAQKLEKRRKKKDTKLKHTTKSWNWSYLTSY